MNIAQRLHYKNWYTDEEFNKTLDFLKKHKKAVDEINENSPVFKKIRKVMIRKNDFVKNASKKLIRFAPENKETE